uniref:Uncharacterized protein n=1 Tax=Globisporangium ultimum (strain ATCC 200006 / CBS 805.95 / DAOM BR144) TaxID=431595 RepID=K3XBP2_GLOUD
MPKTNPTVAAAHRGRRLPMRSVALSSTTSRTALGSRNSWTSRLGNSSMVSIVYSTHV